MPQTLLDYAQWAIARTHESLPNGSDNVQEHRLSVERRDLAEHMVDLVRGVEIQFSTPLEFILKLAKVAEAGKAGNCGEMAAVAFTHLFVEGVHPLRYIRFPSNAGDHSFVVIGDPQNEVVCDPWAGQAYPASEFRENMTTLFQGSPPDFSSLETLWRQGEAGSNAAFLEITQNQEVIEGMDVSN